MAPFDPIKDIPDLNGKVIIVTGGNSGLGEATVTAYAQHNPTKLYLAARSKSRAEEALVRIRATSPAAANANIEVLDLDLGSFDSIKKAATQINAEVDRLDILQLNAGIATVPPATTKEGYEVHFGTNYLGHVLFTQLLMPKLLETAKRPGADVRVVTMSSMAHKTFVPKAGIVFDQLKSDMKAVDSLTLYGQSNLARTLFAYKMAQHYPGIKTTSLHPGVVTSNIWSGEKSMSFFMKNIFFKTYVWFMGVTTEEGAKNQLWCSVSKDVENGCYYDPVGKRADGSRSRDEELAEKLWQWTDKELKGHGGIGWPKRE